MKRINYLVLGAAGLLLASCSNNDVSTPGVAEEGTFSITVKLPGDLSTRALGDGLTATTLKFAVYEVNNGSRTFSFEDEAEFGNSLQTTVNLNLITGKTYQLAFFACSPEAIVEGSEVYTFSPGATTPNISVNYANMTGDNNIADAYDCFYGVTGQYEMGSTLSTPTSITLTRPMAQINWGTNELGANQEINDAFGENGENIQTNLTIKGTIYDQLNIFTREVVPSSDQSITLFQGSPARVPEGSSFPVTPTTYSYLAVQYILAPATSTSNTTGGAVYDLTLNINNGANDGSGEQNITVPVQNAPVQANYQTNIYGNLLSTNAQFTVIKQDYFDSKFDNEVGGASVSFDKTTGFVVCETPNLPEGVDEDDFEEQEAAAVAIGSDGQPVYIPNTAADLKAAMTKYSEIYFAPNTEINTQSHFMQIVNTNTDIVIHGNGAILTGQGSERDISIQYSSSNPATNLSGKTVNLTVNNLNNVKVWGAQEKNTEFTLNLYMNNCTMNGNGIADTSSLIMTRGDDGCVGTVNWYINGCVVNNVQVAMHSIFAGTIEISNCKFTGVGIPINYAKKIVGPAQVTIKDCIFDNCGITPDDPKDTAKAWQYAAPIRVVDFEGKTNSITLLVDGCNFINTLSQWDILLWDYRTDKSRTSYPVDYTIINCVPTDPSVNTITKPETTTVQPSN